MDTGPWPHGSVVAIIGIHGSGKTSLAEALREGYVRSGVRTVVHHIRPWTYLDLLDDLLGANGIHLTAGESHVLCAAEAFRQTTLDVSALRAYHDLVLMDRAAYCTAAGLGTKPNLPERTRLLVEQIVAVGPHPDLTFWLDTPPEVAAQRMEGRGGRAESPETLGALAREYAALSARYGFRRIDGTASRATLVATLSTVIDAELAPGTPGIQRPVSAAHG